MKKAKSAPASGAVTVTSSAKPPRSPASATVSMEPYPEPSPQEIKKENNPFTDRDWRMWTYAWAGFLLRLLLIVGALFTVVQYLTARQERRVERTMQLVELWEQQQYQDAQVALKERLTALNNQYVSMLGPNPTPQQQAVFASRLGLEALRPSGGTMPLPEFKGHFDRIVYFLNRMSSCTTSNLCEASVADEYFKDFAVSFWGYFSGYVQQQRQAGSANYAQPLENYLKGRLPTPPAQQQQP